MFPSKGGHYSREAINGGTAIIRENTVCGFSMYKDNWGISVNDGAHGKILAGKNLCWQGKKLAGKTPVLAGLADVILMKVR